MDKPLVILEIANNHMGDLNHLKNIIDTYYTLTFRYKKIVNFAIKFQFRNLKSFIHPTANKNNKGVKRFTSTELKDSEWKKIIKFTKKKFKIICTPFDEISIKDIEKNNFDFLKIASCSYDDWPLVEKIKKSKLPVICSIGGAEENQITKLLSFFKKKVDSQNFFLMYCVALYPTKINDLNLEYFLKLRNKFGSVVRGFSSHEDKTSSLTGAISYSMGARIFERHINLHNRKYKINDYSIEPKQFNNWLKNLVIAIKINGSKAYRNKNLLKEKKQLRKFQRGVYLSSNTKLSKGDELNKKNTSLYFPTLKNQLTANEFSKYSTFLLKKDKRSLEPIFLKDIKIVDHRSQIEKIKNQIIELIKASKVILPKNIKLEISHHYGLKYFNKFGLSMITIINEKYCKKLLFLINNQSHPKQYHKKKHESFFLLYGKIKVQLNSKSFILKPGDIINIPPRVKHFFKDISKNGSVIEELSTTSDKNDSFYIDKKINKNIKRKSFVSINI